MATSPHHIDPSTYLDELLTQASPDLMRQMLQSFINQILSTQADQVCGADYATTSEFRTNTRNGYRALHDLECVDPVLESPGVDQGPQYVVAQVAEAQCDTS